MTFIKVNKILKVCISLVILGLGYLLSLHSVNAAGLTFVSDQLDRINETTVSKHTILFVTQHGVSAGQTITITFPGSSFSFGGSYDFNDMVLEEGSSNNCTSASFSGETLGGSPSGATWGATYSSGVVTFTSGTGTITADRCVRITLNTNGAGHTLTNPTVASNTVYNINITAGNQDAGELAVVIVNDAGTPDSDQIEIQAEVESVLSFDVDVSTTNCNNSTETSFSQNRVTFGTLSPGVHKVSNASINFICIDAVTNSVNGIYIYAQSARANAVGGLTTTSGGVIASATADLTSGATASGYGIRISSTATPQFGTFAADSPFNNGSTANVGQLPGTGASAAAIVHSTAPAGTGTSSRIAVEVAAKAASDTPAGRYSDTITFTAIANF